MKKIITALLICIVFPLIAGQKIDEKRMARDLEIAKSALATLIKSESPGFYGEKVIEANYIDGFGVIFTIPATVQFFFNRTNFEFNPIIIDVSSVPAPVVEGVGPSGFGDVHEKEVEGDLNKEELEKMKDEARQMSIEAEKFAKDAEKFRQEAEVYRQEAMKQRQEAVVARQEAMAQRQRQPNGKAISNMDWEKIMTSFLADYADLISQLKPEDKIKINKESPQTGMEYVWKPNVKDTDLRTAKASGLTVEVSKKDISAYKSGKLTLEAFTRRVVIKEKKPQKKIPDLEVFGSIFKRYYSPDLSETFFAEGSPKYELLEGFGAVFNIKTYSSYVEGGIYYIPATDQKNINSTERNVIINKLYPKFIEDLKHFIIDYGRTIRSLDDKDHLMLNIKMTRCWNCKIPKNVELTIKMADLKAYDRQKLSAEKALAAINIKEVF